MLTWRWLMVVSWAAVWPCPGGSAVHAGWRGKRAHSGPGSPLHLAPYPPAGNRGYYLKGEGVLLNQALINAALQFGYKAGFKPVQTPFFMQVRGCCCTWGCSFVCSAAREEWGSRPDSSRCPASSRCEWVAVPWWGGAAAGARCLSAPTSAHHNPLLLCPTCSARLWRRSPSWPSVRS